MHIPKGTSPIKKNVFFRAFPKLPLIAMPERKHFFWQEVLPKIESSMAFTWLYPRVHCSVICSHFKNIFCLMIPCSVLILSLILACPSNCQFMVI